jgi:hypothetical protein
MTSATVKLPILGARGVAEAWHLKNGYSQTYPETFESALRQDCSDADMIGSGNARRV